MLLTDKHGHSSTRRALNSVHHFLNRQRIRAQPELVRHNDYPPLRGGITATSSPSPSNNGWSSSMATNSCLTASTSAPCSSHRLSTTSQSYYNYLFQRHEWFSIISFISIFSASVYRIKNVVIVTGLAPLFFSVGLICLIVIMTSEFIK